MDATQQYMPAAFIGHGNPMNTLEENVYTTAWKAFGATLPKPRAILVVSAHWYIGMTAITAMKNPRTIHDFTGFPDELKHFQYPAQGDPTIAKEIAEVITPHKVFLDTEDWGLDHGTWSVLTHVVHDASIPVIQLSINATEPLTYHIELGMKLVTLREQGVVIIGSGNVVHNLRMTDLSIPDFGFNWNHRFNEAVQETMINAPSNILSLIHHPDFAAAVPTPDHFIPLLYLAALCSQGDVTPTVLVDGYVGGALSMTSYVLPGSTLHGG